VTMIKHTPFYHKWKQLGAQFQDRGGFATINYLSSIADEHRAVRERVGIFDVGYQIAIEVKGRDAEKVLEYALVNDVRRLRDGRALYSTICQPNGGILDDLTCFRFSADRFWISPSPSRVPAVLKFLQTLVGSNQATVTNLGLGNGYLSVQGPRSRELLASLTDIDLSTSALPFFAFAEGRLGHIPRAVISRTGFSGELGYELFFPVEYAEYVWDAVVEAGRSHELRPCGMKTLRSLRIEKMYLIYGLDLTADTDPLSAGLGWTVRFQDRDFSGRDALQRIAAAGPARRLCLLETTGFHAISHGEEVRSGKEAVGSVTSADPGHTLGSTYALSYLPIALAEPGQPLEIIAADRNTAPIAARVLTRAPYDPDRRRLTM
jgi:aminomethyltransferase